MLLIKTGRVMDPKSGLDQVCDVLVQDGKIIKIAPEITEEGAETIDATGLVVAPGLCISVNLVKHIKKTFILVPWQPLQVVLLLSS